MKEETLFTLYVASLKEANLSLEQILFNNGIYGLIDGYMFWLKQNQLVDNKKEKSFIDFISRGNSANCFPQIGKNKE